MIKYLSSGQLVHRLERYPDKIEVRGSIPRLPTFKIFLEILMSQIHFNPIVEITQRLL